MIVQKEGRNSCRYICTVDKTNEESMKIYKMIRYTLSKKFIFRRMYRQSQCKDTRSTKLSVNCSIFDVYIKYRATENKNEYKKEYKHKFECENEIIDINITRRARYEYAHEYAQASCAVAIVLAIAKNMTK